MSYKLTILIIALPILIQGHIRLERPIYRNRGEGTRRRAQEVCGRDNRVGWTDENTKEFHKAEFKKEAADNKIKNAIDNGEKFVNTFVAGEDYSVKFSSPNPHGGGGMQFGISYDDGKTFYVMHTTNAILPVTSDLPRPGGFYPGREIDVTFTVPPTLEPCDDCVFTFGWVSEYSGQPEYYTNCADVSIKNENPSQARALSPSTDPIMYFFNMPNFPFLTVFQERLTNIFGENYAIGKSNVAINQERLETILAGPLVKPAEATESSGMQNVVVSEPPVSESSNDTASQDTQKVVVSEPPVSESSNDTASQDTQKVVVSEPPVSESSNDTASQDTQKVDSSRVCDADGKHRGKCCSDSNRCNVGQGDCDKDSHCLDGLYCGLDNCQSEFGWDKVFDCCYKPIKKCANYHDDTNSCCSENNPCDIGEGGCTRDRDCADGLKCGKGNCLSDFNWGKSGTDCCYKP